MSTADLLYELLPAIHRIRDAEQGYPLLGLLTVIAEQVAAMEENLEQLYDDQFIETCASWVAPYIGDLIGYRTLRGVVPKVASPRTDVANTIRYRRRKGTASMLEQMASDVTGWPARAVEFFQLLGWTQNMNHLRSNAHYAPDLRNHEKLFWRDTAFDTLAHTVDVRRISAGAARHNIHNIGIYLWRVRAFSLTQSPAVAETHIDIGNGQCFRFNPLGTDMALYNKPETEEEISHLAEPRNVPMPLGRRWLKEHIEEYYGLGKSLTIERGSPPQLIPIADEVNKKPGICICDLSDIEVGGKTTWAHLSTLDPGNVAIDPVLGRIAFADAQISPPLISFHYGFTTAIGGGDYERGDLASLPDQTVQNGKALQPMFDLESIKNGGTVEVVDNYHYKALHSITVNDASPNVDGKSIGNSVELRAKNGFRPLLKAKNAKINLQLGNDATLIIDGWVIQGYTLIIEGDKPCRLILRDCTLAPRKKDKPCLINNNPFATVELERCITAPLHCVADAKVVLQDCIIDASAQHLIAFRGPGSTDTLLPGGAISLKNCTVIGKVHTQELTLASNCIFTAKLAPGDNWKAPLWAERRQQGCVRFSYVPPGSRTPRRYHCQPEGDGLHIWPEFTSLRYGDSGYCQLLQSTSDKIKRGADDEGEMGVLHSLSQPQRETNLRVRLDEYLRFGLEAGLIYEN